MANTPSEKSLKMIPAPDFGGGLSMAAKSPVPPGAALKPEHSQATRALGLASYFASGCMAINASQVLGTPLYLINPEWYNAWIAFTKQSWSLLMMTMTQWWAPTVVRVSGDSSMRGQLLKTTDGGLVCNFPERLVLMANHQIYTDWLYLWWVGYSAGMHGRIYVVLKESLKKIPIIGWGMQFAQFIFLKRNWEEDKPGLAKHMQKLNKPNDPMWLMLFPEGTNLATCTREKSRKWAEKNHIKDMKHTLLPRSTGLHFMLQNLKDNVEYVYDCTIAYEGVAHGAFAQDIFTVGASYFGGRPPKSVNMYWRRFRVDTIPLDDPRKFELWLRMRWREKDKFIDQYLRTGRFPADSGSNNNHKGQCLHGAGHVEAEIRPKYWYEFLQVFAPIGVFALVLYLFYGALPQEMVNKIKSIDQKTAMKQIEAIQKGEIKVPETKDIIAIAPKDLQDKYDAVQRFAASQNTSAEKMIAEAKKALPAGTLPAGDPGALSKPNLKPTPTAPATSQLANALPTKPSSAPKPNISSSAKTDDNAQPPLPPVLLKNLEAQKSKANSLKPSPAAKKPLAKSTGTAKVPTSGSGKVKPAKPLTKGRAQAKPLDAPKATSIGSKKSVSLEKPTAPVPKQAVQGTQPENKAPDPAVVRHAMKKEARTGKQEPKRKLRRAVEAAKT